MAMFRPSSNPYLLTLPDVDSQQYTYDDSKRELMHITSGDFQDFQRENVKCLLDTSRAGLLLSQTIIPSLGFSPFNAHPHLEVWIPNPQNPCQLPHSCNAIASILLPDFSCTLPQFDRRY